MLTRIKNQFFGTKPVSSAPLARPPALVLARKVREAGDVWFSAKSYLGGMPRLGSTPWPTDENGKPLYFMAQLDCGEIVLASGGQSVLPKTGALAFFIGGIKTGRIVHVAAPGATFTSAPAERGRAQDVGGHELISQSSTHGPKEFPFWPVEFHNLGALARPDPEDEEAYDGAYEAQAEAIEARFERRAFHFSVKSACERAGLASVPLYWHSALLFAERVPLMLEAVARAKTRGAEYIATSMARLAALDAGLPPPKGQGPWNDPAKDRANADGWLSTGRKIVADAEANEAAVADYVARVKSALPPVDPWRAVTASDAARLDTLFSEARSKAFEDFSCFALPHSWRDYASDTVRLMMSGPEEAFTRLPKVLRDVVNQSCRLPTGGAHLMFGLGTNVQGNRKHEEADQNLVLQLLHDDMQYWPFGDNGVYQFWMSDAALKAQDFSKSDATFECH